MSIGGSGHRPHLPPKNPIPPVDREEPRCKVIERTERVQAVNSKKVLDAKTEINKLKRLLKHVSNCNRHKDHCAKCILISNYVKNL